MKVYYTGNADGSIESCTRRKALNMAAVLTGKDRRELEELLDTSSFEVPVGTKDGVSAWVETVEDLKSIEDVILETRPTYNYCGLCGHVPKKNEEPNRDPVKWWDCDDGWKVTALCKYCIEDTRVRVPKRDDFAVMTHNESIDIDTESDPTTALL